MKFVTNRKRSDWTVRAALASLAASGAAFILAITSLAMVPVSSASATTPRATSGAICNVAISAGTGTVAGSLIIGVSAGTTKITLDCNTSSSAAIVAEASLLSGVGTLGVSRAGEADTGALGTFTASITDTGCPAATAGSCTIATFLVPAKFSATDTKAACPPTQAEINAGLYGCVLAVATAQEAPVAGAEYLMTYATETTLPSAPTIASTLAAGPAGSTITVSDAAASTGTWWANAVQNTQAVAFGVAPMIAPSTCGSGGGYGNVPSQFLAVNWFPSASTTAIAGDASGVSISDDCYDGTTLHAPALSGTIPVPSGVSNGTTYTVYLCELNLTPFPSNDQNAATDCGPAPAGESWIDASFPFTVAAGTVQSPLTLTSLSGTVGTPLTLTSTGGSGTGAVTFDAANGTATGCAVTGSTLTASSAGTCSITVRKAGDTNYLVLSSTPSLVSFAATPAVKLATTKVVLVRNAWVLPIRISCSGGQCSGSLTVSALATVSRLEGGRTQSVVETVTFGSASYELGTGTSKNISIPLTASSRKYLATSPNRPTLPGSVYITDNLGKKHSYIGRVSLLK